ncbi:MAG: hypothetical protein AAGG08_02265 [Actinomycetota bacterium]
MSAATVVDTPELARLLKQLLGRDVKVSKGSIFASHPLTRCGLVDNDDRLVGVISSDLAFAHISGASLAMIPAGVVEDAGDEPVDSWLEFYREVANVLSRTVNEASPQRVRLDPGIQHAAEALEQIEAGGGLLAAEVEVAGYGTGRLLLGVNGL